MLSISTARGFLALYLLETMSADDVKDLLSITSVIPEGEGFLATTCGVCHRYELSRDNRLTRTLAYAL